MWLRSKERKYRCWNQSIVEPQCYEKAENCFCLERGQRKKEHIYDQAMIKSKEK